MKSLANTEKFPTGVGLEINREMMVWDKNIGNGKESRKIVTCWNGACFCSMFGSSSFQWYSHACEVETDENSFVRDGVRYVAIEGECQQCAFNSPINIASVIEKCPNQTGEVGCYNHNRKDRRSIIWKRADTQTRPMTARDIYELAHQGAAFAYFGRINDGIGFYYLTSVFKAIDIICEHRYSLPCDMTDDEPKTWNWRELKTERKLEKVG